MFKKSHVQMRAASVKRTLDSLHANVDALSNADERERVQTILRTLHAQLNRAAHELAEVFDADAEAFSGGTDKPQEN